MYMFQALDNIGNCHKISMYIFYLMLCVTTNTMLVRLVDCCDFINDVHFLVCCM